MQKTVSVEIQKTTIISFTGSRPELLSLIQQYKGKGWVMTKEFAKLKDQICFVEIDVFTTSMQKDE